MTDSYDPFEVLKENNPVSRDDADYTNAERAEAVVARAKSIVEHRAVNRRRRRIMVIAVTVFVVLTAGIAVAVFSRPVTEPLGFSCHQETNLEGFRIGVQTGPDLGTDACVEYWERGDLINPDVARPGEVPPLTACVTDQGGLAVFPSADLSMCADLGLAPPEPASMDDADSVRRLQTQLAEAFLEVGCASLDEAEQIVVATLDSLGFPDWSIESDPPTAARPCMSVGVNPSSQTIRLTPIPPSPDN